MRHGVTGVRAGLLMGVAVLALTRDARSAEPLDDRLGVRSAPIFLLTRADIQKDLGVEAAQIAEIQREAAELDRKVRLEGEQSQRSRGGAASLTTNRANGSSFISRRNSAMPRPDRASVGRTGRASEPSPAGGIPQFNSGSARKGGAVHFRRSRTTAAGALGLRRARRIDPTGHRAVL